LFGNQVENLKKDKKIFEPHKVSGGALVGIKETVNPLSFNDIFLKS
jgi:hypothetical protein